MDGTIVNPTPIEYSCSNGLSYDPLTTRCRNMVTDCIEPPPCTSVGEMFPIPENSIMYYVCLHVDVGGLLHQPLYCPNIDEEFINGACRDPTPTVGVTGGKCTAVGTFYDPDDCKKYFICDTVDADPDIRDCDLGTNFDPWQEECVPFKC